MKPTLLIGGRLGGRIILMDETPEFIVVNKTNEISISKENEDSRDKYKYLFSTNKFNVYINSALKSEDYENILMNLIYEYMVSIKELLPDLIKDLHDKLHTFLSKIYKSEHKNLPLINLLWVNLQKMYNQLDHLTYADINEFISLIEFLHDTCISSFKEYYPKEYQLFHEIESYFSDVENKLYNRKYNLLRADNKELQIL